MTYYKSFPEIAHTTKTNQQTNKKCICKREGCEREGERERERDRDRERQRVTGLIDSERRNLFPPENKE